MKFETFIKQLHSSNPKIMEAETIKIKVDSLKQLLKLAYEAPSKPEPESNPAGNMFKDFLDYIQNLDKKP